VTVRAGERVQGPAPSAFRVMVTANPEHPHGEEFAEEARQVIRAALCAAGFPDHPPRSRLRLVPDLPGSSQMEESVHRGVNQ
jgi:hypothetical protein